MNENREGESGPAPFRSGRMFSIGADWYFSTREGDRGPFPTREEAIAELALYMRDKATEDERIG
ncbi:DUF6316 family protein [Thiohalomonas denitrificans]|uniref:DUF6316 domain-containing protein n=1 Tax=Thiohalomonas denitrificans TaxID=415747 RepID=A0A1G5PTL0_9GAMM|nr:DUF6316 family protein [Thiohalomonas denitrificans]SCZ52747.1 hypothetical protein SAMN03097708_00796 [Thiohalomonas denitrificans]